MSEIAIRHPAEVAVPVSDAADLDGWIAVVQDVSRLADAICGTEFVPKNYRNNPPAAMAAILTGRELGLPPMTALRHVQLVEGSASLSAEYKRARVLAAGHEFDIVSIDTKQCTVSGRRRGSSKPPTVITYTIEDARTARLVKDKGAWYTRPRRMLFARAGTELCDFLFADVTNGLPTTELLTDDGDGLGGYDEQPRSNGRVTADEIKARRSAAPDASPAGEAPDPTTAGASSSAHAPDSTSQQRTGAPSQSSPDGSASDPDDSDYDTPGTVTKAQLTYLGTAFTGLGFTGKEREQRLVAASQIVGRELDSSSELSRNEASTLIDTLEGCDGSRDKLIALLVDGEKPPLDGDDDE